MTRPNWDEYFMGFAKAAATRGTCDRKQVGAVIVVEKQVVATGYNGSAVGMPHCSNGPCEMEPDENWHPHNGTQGEYCKFCHYGNNYSVCPKNPGAGHDMVDGHCVRTIHAEMNAVAQAARRGVRVDGATIYTTASPCWDCFRVLVNTGIQSFIFLEPYRVGEDADRIKAVVQKLRLNLRQL